MEGTEPTVRFKTIFETQDLSTEEKIAYLHSHLSKETFERLEANNFFIGKPFPSHESFENWIDEAEKMSEENAVPESIVLQDMESWKHVI